MRIEKAISSILVAERISSLFMFCQSKIFHDTPEVLQDSISVFAICDKRDIHHPEMNIPMLQEGSTFPYKLLLCACEENVSDDEFGRTFAPALETYINENPRYHGTDNHVVYRQPAVLTAEANSQFVIG